MPLAQISLANTFSELLGATVSLITLSNLLETGDYHKTSNTLYIDSSGTGLLVANNSAFNGQASFNGLGLSIIVNNNAYVGGNVNVSNQIISTVPYGNSPFLINSKTLNINLNAEFLNGINSDYYLKYTGFSFTQANVAYNMANVAFAQANVAYNMANVAFTKANSAGNDAVNAFIQANTGVLYTQAAFTKANSAGNDAVNSFTQANVAYNMANVAFAQANVAFTKANSAGNDAVNSFTQANVAYNMANVAFTKANSAGNDAVNAFTKANSAGNDAVNAFTKANTGVLYAQSAYFQANNVSLAWDTANSAFISSNSNSTFIFAASAFSKANSAGNDAVNAYTQANTGVLYAQAAFEKANTGGASSTLTDDSITNINRPLVLTSNTNGQQFNSVYVNSSQLYTNPSTGTLYATIFSSLSDETQKDNISRLKNSTNLINSINPVSFNWKKTGKKSYGVIAQEIEKILPEIVHENDGIKSVEYDSLIAILISAVQELSDKIEKLENK